MRLLPWRRTRLPVNYWRDDRCAKAFWSQYEIPAYKQLLADTTEWLDPRPGERWIDLGCGSGRLSRALWAKSEGAVAEVIGLDVAALNAASYEKLQRTMQPVPGNRLRFEHVDFSAGLPWRDGNLFNGAVSGLALQYAECWSEREDRWTSDSYDRLLRDVHRVLKPGGRFVFSVNVPEPSWGRVAVSALRGVFSSKRKVRYLLKLWGMWSYGGWLKREARKGRFHYLPAEVVSAKLMHSGFGEVEHRLSFAKQAYLFRCKKR